MKITKEQIKQIDIFIIDNSCFAKYENDCRIADLDIMRSHYFCDFLYFNVDQVKKYKNVEVEDLTREIIRLLESKSSECRRHLLSDYVFEDIRSAIIELRNNDRMTARSLHISALKKASANY